MSEGGTETFVALFNVFSLFLFTVWRVKSKMQTKHTPRSQAELSRTFQLFWK